MFFLCLSPYPALSCRYEKLVYRVVRWCDAALLTMPTLNAKQTLQEHTMPKLVTGLLHPLNLYPSTAENLVCSHVSDVTSALFVINLVE